MHMGKLNRVIVWMQIFNEKYINSSILCYNDMG